MDKFSPIINISQDFLLWNTDLVVYFISWGKKLPKSETVTLVTICFIFISKRWRSQTQSLPAIEYLTFFCSVKCSTRLQICIETVGSGVYFRYNFSLNISPQKVRKRTKFWSENLFRRWWSHNFPHQKIEYCRGTKSIKANQKFASGFLARFR